MKVLFYDFETTGLPKRGDDPNMQPGICEVGAVLVDTDDWKDYADDDPLADGIKAEFVRRVNPEIGDDRWEAGAIKVHGIEPRDIANEPSWFTVGEEFAAFAVGAEILSGYNIIDFDNKILEWQLRRYGMMQHFPWPPRHVDLADVVKRSGKYVGKRGPKFPKLVELYADLTGSPLEGAHGALADVRATATCARRCAAHAYG